MGSGPKINPVMFWKMWNTFALLKKLYWKIVDWDVKPQTIKWGNFCTCTCIVP